MCIAGARQGHRRGHSPGADFSLQVWDAESWRTCGTESACLGLMCGVSTLQMAPMPVLW